mmetsp:Transcript_14814/g.29997  ORF Transcript_14814/g.29997 Transcript_14814/m.29997 type:complete len:85 (-) Transcript_14814:294-548(-)
MAFRVEYHHGTCFGEKYERYTHELCRGGSDTESEGGDGEMAWGDVRYGAGSFGFGGVFGGDGVGVLGLWVGGNGEVRRGFGWLI